MKAYVFLETDRELEADDLSVIAATPQDAIDKVLEASLGWRYKYPTDRERMAERLKSGSVVAVDVSRTRTIATSDVSVEGGGTTKTPVSQDLK